VVLLAGFSIPAAQQQEKTKDSAPAVDAGKSAGAERKNPVKPTPEGMAAAKKIYGYDCAMCHGASGNGKGDVAASMNLTMKDWREPAVLAGMSDADVYDIIVKGKDKMIGEGDRLPPEKAWNMVNYVRSMAKKEGAEKAPAAAPKS
jgi:mono/diheme cytochrome c family protein